MLGRECVVSNTELVASLNVVSSFNTATIALMPRNTGNWSNILASLFARWKWERLRLIYIPVCGTTTPGSIHLAPLYDHNDTVPVNTADMSTLYGYVASPGWGGSGGTSMLKGINAPQEANSVVCDIDCASAQEKWYPAVTTATYNAALSLSPSVANTLCPARMVYATSDGTATSAVLGRLYIQYVLRVVDPMTYYTNA